MRICASILCRLSPCEATTKYAKLTDVAGGGVWRHRRKTPRAPNPAPARLAWLHVRLPGRRCCSRTARTRAEGSRRNAIAAHSGPAPAGRSGRSAWRSPCLGSGRARAAKPSQSQSMSSASGSVQKRIDSLFSIREIFKLLLKR